MPIARPATVLVALSIIAAMAVVCQGQLSEGIEERFPMPDTIMAIEFHPQVMIESSRDRAQCDELVNRVREKLGVDLASATKIGVRFGCNGELADRDDEQFLLTLESAETVRKEDIFNGLFSRVEFESENYDGHTIYLTERGDSGPCLHWSDEQTVLAGIVPRIKNILDQPLAAEPSTLLVDLDAEADLCGYINFARHPDDARRVVTSFFKGAPFSTSEFNESIATIRTGVFNIRIADDLALDAVLETGNEDEARRLADELEKALESFREEIRQSLDDVAMMPPEMMELIRSLSTGMLDILEHATASSDGPRVMLRVEKPGGMGPCLDQFLKGMSIAVNEFN